MDNEKQLADSAARESLEKVFVGALGWDLSNPNFTDTPMRWLKFMREYTQSYDPAEDLSKTFPPDNPQDDFHTFVMQTGIPYQALCAHHLAPVIGFAHVGYIATDKNVGLSKLTRLVHGIAHRRPSLQEDVANEVVDSLMKHLEPLGAICMIRAEHGCMASRGVAHPGIMTTTTSLRGVFKERQSLVDEAYQIIALEHK